MYANQTIYLLLLKVNLMSHSSFTSSYHKISTAVPPALIAQLHTSYREHHHVLHLYYNPLLGYYGFHYFSCTGIFLTLDVRFEHPQYILTTVSTCLEDTKKMSYPLVSPWRKGISCVFFKFNTKITLLTDLLLCDTIYQ